MKTIFEEKDIKAGVYIIRNSCKNVKDNPSFAISVSYLIGWTPSKMVAKVAMSDGMILLFNLKTLCESLNNDKFGYRKLKRSELKLLFKERVKWNYNKY